MSFAKVSPGQPLHIPAETFNAFVDAAAAYQAERLGRRAGETRPDDPAGTVLVRNDSGAARPRFAVLTLGNPLIVPGDIQRFPTRLAFRGLLPDAAKPGRFAILQEPTAAGALGRARLDGITPVAIDILAAGDPYAEVVAGQAEALRSGLSGSALILWAEAGTGRRQAVVRLLGPGGAAAASGDRLEITVTQGGHGFRVGHVLYATAIGFARAEADVVERSRVAGVVSAVADVNTFTLVLAGRVNGFSPSSTLYTLAPGTTYYLRAGYPGIVTADPGLDQVPVFATTTVANEILVGNQVQLYRPTLGRRVYQLNHGFTVGTVIAGNGSGLNFSPAIANPAQSYWSAPVGVVSAVIDAHHFAYVAQGIVSGLLGVSAYAEYYLSDTTAGLFTALAPAQPIAIGWGIGPGQLAVDIQRTWRALTIGDASHTGILRVQGAAAGGDAVVIDASLVTAANRALSLREVDVCSGGVAKKMLILASNPY